MAVAFATRARRIGTAQPVRPGPDRAGLQLASEHPALGPSHLDAVSPVTPRPRSDQSGMTCESLLERKSNHFPSAFGSALAMLHPSMARRRTSAPSTIWPTSCSPPPTASPKPAAPASPTESSRLCAAVVCHALASLPARDFEYGADKIRHCPMALFVVACLHELSSAALRAAYRRGLLRRNLCRDGGGRGGEGVGGQLRRGAVGCAGPGYCSVTWSPKGLAQRVFLALPLARSIVQFSFNLQPTSKSWALLFEFSF